MNNTAWLNQQIQSSPLTKHWEREYSLFFLSMTAHAHRLANAAGFGDGALTLALFTLQNGVCAYYRKTQDNERLFATVRQKMAKNPEVLNKILESYDQRGRGVEVFNDAIKTQQTFSIDWLKLFVNTWGELIGYQLFVHRMVDFLGDSSEDQKIAEAFSVRRIRYEKLFGFFETTFEELREKLATQYRIENPDLLSYLTTEECLHVLEKRELPKDIEMRKLPTVLVTLPGLSVLIGQEAGGIIKTIAENQERLGLETAGEVRGATAHGEGRVEGVARVITDYADLASLKEGDILVTPSTLPKYELFYRRAKAIVTDEGGMLSHVAVFCREAKKPAIIGTRIATKRIENGRGIQLDLDKGAVFF